MLLERCLTSNIVLCVVGNNNLDSIIITIRLEGATGVDILDVAIAILDHRSWECICWIPTKGLRRAKRIVKRVRGLGQ